MHIPLEVNNPFLLFLKQLLYALLGLMADILDTMVVWARQPTSSMAPSDMDHLSDEEILALMEHASSLPGPDNHVRRLTPGTVVKMTPQGFNRTDSEEANALNLVFSKTTIPVPRVHRVINIDDVFLIVMDYIPGRTLAKVWPTLLPWQKIGIALTLRRYIRQLRRLKASDTTPPGPISRDGAQACESPVFGLIRSSRGPFSSYAELADFFNARHKMAADEQRLPLDHPWRREKFEDSGALVLTHQDLNQRNIVLGVDGRLWILDWAWSGYYPPWFEHVTMQEQNRWERADDSSDFAWKILIPFMAGPYFWPERWHRRMCASFINP